MCRVMILCAQQAWLVKHVSLDTDIEREYVSVCVIEERERRTRERREREEREGEKREKREKSQRECEGESKREREGEDRQRDREGGELTANTLCNCCILSYLGSRYAALCAGLSLLATRNVCVLMYVYLSI